MTAQPPGTPPGQPKPASSGMQKLGETLTERLLALEQIQREAAAADNPPPPPSAIPRFSPAVSITALIAANSIPLLGVFFLGWRVFPIILIYWIENVIVGLFNVVRILFAKPDDPLLWISKLFLIPFFCIHYGMFTYIHGVFVFTMFDTSARHGWPTAASVMQAVTANGINVAVFALFMSHAVSFVWNYLINGEFRRSSPQELMGRPYERIVVLHLVIIFGGMATMALGSPVAAIALLVVIKSGIDVAAHLRERAKIAGGHGPHVFDLALTVRRTVVRGGFSRPKDKGSAG